MPHDSRIRKRKSIRLKGYDYTQPGAYFITIVMHWRKSSFGEIIAGEMRLNAWGRIAAECWSTIPDHFPNVELDEFIVMPNHMHGIIIIGDESSQTVVGATQWVAPTDPQPDLIIPGGKTTIVPNSIGSIIGQYKSIVAKRINHTRATPGAPVWHRNYWEHIIRSGEELGHIRDYIQKNPSKWRMDEENQSSG